MSSNNQEKESTGQDDTPGSHVLNASNSDSGMSKFNNNNKLMNPAVAPAVMIIIIM